MDPADDHRNLARHDQILGDRDRVALITRDGGGLLHVENVEQVMRNPATLGRRQFGGPDIHAAIELHRVDVDDFTAEFLGQCQREIGLSRRCRTDNCDRAKFFRDVHGRHVPTW